jgi:murein DD-endopeptidase MepM/ murein hydrolase activator NlpD
MRRIATIAALLGALLMSTVAPAGADLSDDLRRVDAQLDDLRAAVGDVREERSDLANRILDTGARLEVLTARLADAETRLADTDRALVVATLRAAELTERIAVREARVEQLRLEVDSIRSAAVERAVELYMRGESNPVLDVFRYEDVGTLNIGVVYASRAQAVADRTIAALENLSVTERREQERIEAERLELEAQVELLEFQQEERAAAAAHLDERQAEAAVELALQEEQFEELESEVAYIEGEIAALAREEEQIRELIRRQSAQGGTRPGALFRPVPGGVSSGYGYRIHPIYGDRRLHTGWDMNAGCGAPIRAAEAGTVIYSGVKGGYGSTIIIDHGGGLSTLYAHQSTLGAGYGVVVEVGEVIGWIGSTGVSTSCHLHFEVRVNGVPVDPTPYM